VGVTYRLTTKGKALTWDAWKALGGCGRSQWATFEAGDILRVPESRWGDVPLGDFGMLADRELARFAVEHLGRKDLAEESR